jgi:hypothetical protein
MVRSEGVVGGGVDLQPWNKGTKESERKRTDLARARRELFIRSSIFKGNDVATSYHSRKQRPKKKAKKNMLKYVLIFVSSIATALLFPLVSRLREYP